MREPIMRVIVIVCVLSGAPGPGFANEVLQDPTRPYVAGGRTMVASPNFTVNAIIVSSERRVAIVNGRRVGVGGLIDGAKVISIDKEKLILEKDGKRITAALHDGASRQ